MGVEHAFSIDAVGQTPDGKRVMSGIFKVYNTIGLPLDVIVEALDQTGCVVDWEDFYVEARRCKMSHEAIMVRMEDAMSDVFGQAGVEAVRVFRRRVEESV